MFFPKSQGFLKKINCTNNYISQYKVKHPISRQREFLFTLFSYYIVKNLKDFLRLFFHNVAQFFICLWMWNFEIWNFTKFKKNIENIFWRKLTHESIDVNHIKYLCCWNIYVNHIKLNVFEISKSKVTNYYADNKTVVTQIYPKWLKAKKNSNRVK